MTQLIDAVTTALNCTFPAVLRTRSWYALERLHDYASYEQWYNAEVIMHLGRELHGSHFEGKQVWVRGEPTAHGKSGRPDWIIHNECRDQPVAKSFDADHVLAVGESKVVWLGPTGDGPARASEKFAKQAGDFESKNFTKMACFATIILPCWGNDKRNLDDVVTNRFDEIVSPNVYDHFSVQATRKDTQVVIGWPGAGYADEKFALLWLLLRRLPGKDWKVVDPAFQHRLEQYLEKEPAIACAS